MMMDAEGAAVEVVATLVFTVGVVGMGFRTVRVDAVFDWVGTDVVAGGALAGAVEATDAEAVGGVMAGPVIGVGFGVASVMPTTIRMPRRTAPPPAAAHGIHFGFGFAW